MMLNPILLNPLNIPLNQINLIEASAGTGKTYTIGSLYLRLLLQRGENAFSRPLNVEEILVVTFTEMATEELKKKIRERITDAIAKFTAVAQAQDLGILNNDEFLTALCPPLDELPLAIRRLKLAEQNMDLAAIFTIHGFCRRMLMQYAFHSGIHFNVELLKDQSALYAQFAQEFWREQFYALPFEMANFISNELGSPENVLAILQKDLGKIFQPNLENRALLSLSLAELLDQQVGKRLGIIRAIKQTWLENEIEIKNAIEKEVGEKRLKGASLWQGRIKKMTNWANDPLNYGMIDEMPKYFTQSAINLNAMKDKQPLSYAVFERFDELVSLIETAMPTSLLKKLVLYHYRQGIEQKLLEYKRNHVEKGFDDLLRLLREALYQPNGGELAEMIRFQYPFAMIDEFQDTDAQQYDIFSKIYRDNPQTETGFIMIGDPKQAIYRFRGADIFTYLNAAENATARFNLAKNYRSAQNVVSGVNALFDFQSAPFIYSSIDFTPVSARDDHLQFYVKDKKEPAFRFYLSEGEDNKALARVCAISIQHWLKSAAENQAVFANKLESKTLQAANIAVLVRNYQEADLVKAELQKLGIASVYLSDQSSVFDSPVARELVLVLKACLSATERPILNAISTALFGLNAAEIHQIHQNENQWQRWANNFAHYQQLWQRQGILPMLHHLLLEQGISERLLKMPNGERHLTDLLHLAEILQQAAALNESEAALLRWFEKQIQGEGREEAQIRLESERQLVKIVTIHKSKGLEYDLVWLPFLGSPVKDPSKKGKQDREVNLYYEEKDQQIYWDMDNRHLSALFQETFAEELRLLYVALTRAKYQMAFALPAAFEEKWNALLYVLTQGEIGQNLALNQRYETAALLNEFAEKLPSNVVVSKENELIPLPPLAFSLPNEQLAAADFYGEIEQNWRVTSFTGIEQQHRYHQYLAQIEDEIAGRKTVVLDETKDYEQHILTPNSTALSPIDSEKTPILDFPRGTNVGTLLHRYIEKQPLSQLDNETEVQKLCQQLQLDEQMIPALQHWFHTLSHTAIFADIDVTLAQLRPQDCLKEMPFYLAIRENFDVVRFNRALATHHHLPSEPLQFEDIQGIVRGTIDLVFRHQGKYYLIDYKSNFLGENREDYAAAQLEKIMLHHHYDWQYLLYTLALHRYLKSVSADYDYERDFGGVAYLFLRGMTGEPQSGVFYDKPSVALINALEEVF